MCRIQIHYEEIHQEDFLQALRKVPFGWEKEKKSKRGGIKLYLWERTILSNKRVICKLTITPIQKMATPMCSNMATPMWTQDSLHKMAGRGG